jgi:hypothetical protein
MRFANVPLPKVEQRSPAAEFVRKLLGAEKSGAPQPSQAQPAEPPIDLDQRVRLLGKW